MLSEFIRATPFNKRFLTFVVPCTCICLLYLRLCLTEEQNIIKQIKGVFSVFSLLMIFLFSHFYIDHF